MTGKRRVHLCVPEIVGRPLKWLSQIELQRDILETEQSYVPGYAPHLEAFLEAIVKYRSAEVWRELKKTQDQETDLAFF